ncbi:MAG TPA: hypothetical protein VF471_14630 [Pseudoxanthomonas sp.]
MREKAPLCPELAAVLKYELGHGNSLAYGPAAGDWPSPGSVFAQLQQDFSIPKTTLSDGLELAICDDPHYGWYHELYCHKHEHLLVAGKPRPGQPMRAKV